MILIILDPGYLRIPGVFFKYRSIDLVVNIIVYNSTRFRKNITDSFIILVKPNSYGSTRYHTVATTS